MSQTRSGYEQKLAQLKKRLVLEATQAVNMLESALAALWVLDVQKAIEVRRRDDSIDAEEVQIERECIRFLAMEQPVATDLRQITFILRVNTEVERVADHATSIAKVVKRIVSSNGHAKWPTSLTELGQRVPMVCHALLRAVLDEDVSAAQQLIADDEVIDKLERSLFFETLEMMRVEDNTLAAGMHIYRVARELERVADIMADIARDLIFLKTGEIVRHRDKAPPALRPAGGAGDEN